MLKQYINVTVILGSAWYVYAIFQQDFFLPAAAGAILIFTLLLRIRSTAHRFKIFENLGLSAIIIFSVVFGLLYRIFVPPPELAVSPYPEMISAIQAGSIVAALCFWLKPFTKKNFFSLAFTAWLTVATSINIPFEMTNVFPINFFCIVATAVIILNSMKRPKDKKYTFRFYRGFSFFSIVIIFLTVVLFHVITAGIVAFESSVLNIMNRYVMPYQYTHFLRLDPILQLNSPGRSAFDRHPVLEITMPKARSVYLKTQVFESFNDGVWSLHSDPQKTPLPDRLDERLTSSQLTMFTSFKDVVPVPKGVVAARGNVTYLKANDETVYTPDEQRARSVRLSIADKNSPTLLSDRELKTFTHVPPVILDQLEDLSSSLVPNAQTARAKAMELRDYFRNKYDYSLSVDYKGDNAGIIQMIREQRPAYCSYFATAFTLLLRAEGIPARVVTGFLTDEIIDKRNQKFLARVKDAHAWAEVLLPAVDPLTGETLYFWQRYDPTPPGGLLAPRDRPFGFQFAQWREMMLLAMLRFKVFVEDMDRDKFKRDLIWALIGVMILFNLKKIFRLILGLSVRTRGRRKGVTPDEFKNVYRHYESFLKKKFDEVRRSCETDEDVFKRLARQPDASGLLIKKAKTFLNRYHAARFGRADININEMLLVLDK